MKDFKKGILLTLVLSFSVVYLFFGPLMKDPNQVYFSPHGDGLKSYAAAIYHVYHDSTLFRANIQNYPYGEMAFFAASQPMISIRIKMMSNVGIDVRPYFVGIANLGMLLSIVVAAIFLYLLFTEFQVAWWFAAIASVGIAMLSPQIGRLGGHFSVVHLMWLPMLMWLLLRFDRHKSWMYSILIGLTTFLAAGMHMYFFALFGFLFLFYWIYVLVWGNMKVKEYKWVLHVFIQLIIPLILVQILTGFNDTVTDRTTHPWGLFVFRAYFESVFLPLGRPYAGILQTLKVKQDFEWEAYAFIGLVALIGIAVGIIYTIIGIVKGRAWWKVGDSNLLTAFLWASVASLLLSFSIPFNWGLKSMLEYLGPIQQLRALARFSWLFYYVINVLVFIGIYRLWKRGIFMKVIAVASLAFLLYDGYLNIRVYAPQLNNRIPELEDASNSTPENAWVSLINPNDYQAILPLPYFHVGSENVWLESKCESMRQSVIVSLKSGLPSMGVSLSRTSISQSYKSLELISTPVGPYRVKSDLPNSKPILVMVDNCNNLTPNERNIVEHSTQVWQGPKFAFYSLPVARLDTIALKGQKAYESEMRPIYEGTADSMKVFHYDGFELSKTDKAFAGEGAFTAPIARWSHPVEKKITNGLPGDSCELTFWVKGYETDLLARSIFEFVQKDGDEVKEYKYDQFQHYFVSFKNDWMRIRIPFVLKSANDLVLLAIMNEEMKDFQLVLDDVVIRKLP
ncbi:MAG TPA: hypothetical protein VFG54_04110 [Prolixibacteraceae bacterium]|nr:hypothetical protein [Prolixibacteraceae bacterium]